MKGKDLKPHIGIFGKRNNGKSSLINLLTGQDIAIVSDKPGTTTDPVKKSVEIFGIGPAIIIDTAGIDDTGELGKMRTNKSFQVIPTVDFALLIIAENKFGKFEKQLIKDFDYYNIPYLIIHNKSDIEKLDDKLAKEIYKTYSKKIFEFNIFDTQKLDNLVQLIKENMPLTVYRKPSLFAGIIKPKDLVLLVTPIDSEAPEGRMILPQVMAIRDILDNDGICVTVKETELEDFLKTGIVPKIVVTDSQAFAFVSKIVPPAILLTSFSILFAHLKGNFEKFIHGTPFIGKLDDGDTVLMLESCTHHVSCEDIGRYKLPAWIKKFTGKEIKFEIKPGLSEIDKKTKKYKMVIQCGGCVVTEKQIKNRLKPFIDSNIPVSNYGLAIAYLNGIFDRVTTPFLNKNN